jgi:tetratricopeptide (TPR) repeat protein
VTVECVTCHRGLGTPRTLAAELAAAMDNGGTAAAVARYRELRAAWYGSGGYDFGQGTLNQLGEVLLRQKRAADALPLITLNLEFFPEAPWTRYLAGEAYRALGQLDRARAEYEKSAALDAQNPMPRRRLKELAESPAPPRP